MHPNLNSNARAFLLPLAGTFVVVTALTFRYPPACYTELEAGLMARIQASVPLLQTAWDAITRTAALAVLPGLLFGTAQVVGQVRHRPVAVVGLLWAGWLLAVGGWLLSGAWYPNSSYD